MSPASAGNAEKQVTGWLDRNSIRTQKIQVDLKTSYFSVESTFFWVLRNEDI
jgi:hypothetical protein